MVWSQESRERKNRLGHQDRVEHVKVFEAPYEALGRSGVDYFVWKLVPGIYCPDEKVIFGLGGVPPFLQLEFIETVSG